MQDLEDIVGGNSPSACARVVLRKQRVEVRRCVRAQLVLIFNYLCSAVVAAGHQQGQAAVGAAAPRRRPAPLTSH